MKVRVVQVQPGEALWPKVAALFPRVMRWMQDPRDGGDYRFFAATDGRGAFLGASVMDVGPMHFGPLSDVTIGFLEDIHVLEPHRRKGVGTALLRATLEHAWVTGCQNVRWTVEYGNQAGIALYESMGCGFVPEEDPDAEQPLKCYTVVAINPKRVNAGYSSSKAIATRRRGRHL